MAELLDKRDHRINVKINSLERKMIEENMKATGYTNISSYARRMMIDGKVEVTTSKVDDTLIYEVNKIGNNINQIAKQLNSSFGVRTDDVKEIKSEMKKLWQLLSANL
ncbi:MAG: MobC family plasmid mobilization relaxosome protein [Clostridia bacterium]|nr:MobC family plasmid mobilization relaxosome protein [Clostridia bacterium]